MDLETQKIINKIQKLLQLADTKKNTNLEEATTAAIKAQELMEKYRIEQAMLDATHPNSISTQPLADEGLFKNWKIYLANVLCKHNGCYLVLSQENKMQIVGENKDIDTIQSIYKYITFELNRLCMTEMIKFKVTNGFFPTEKYTNGFYLGAISIIDKRLQEVNKSLREKHIKRATSVEEAQEISNALAKLDTRIETAKQWVARQFGPDSIKTVTEKFEDIGYFAGQKAAKELDLTSDDKKLK